MLEFVKKKINVIFSVFRELFSGNCNWVCGGKFMKIVVAEYCMGILGGYREIFLARFFLI